MLVRKDQLINEFINNGKLLGYENIVIDLIEKILQHKFTISVRYDSDQSVINWTDKYIKISLIKEPLHILWDLFHEYGHLASGEKLTDSNFVDYYREVRAWENASIELSKYENLLTAKENFTQYRIKCLKSFCNRIKKLYGKKD